MLKRVLVFLVVLCFVIIISWYGYDKFFAGKNGKAGQMPITAVTTAVVSQREWQQTILANGQLTAGEGITLAPEVQGRVTGIYFKSGQFVKKETPLVQLYPDILKANLAKALASLSIDQDTYERYAQLYQKGFYAKLNLDIAKAQVAQDQANVDSIRSNLDQLLIKAPFDGMLGIRQISLGQYLNAGDAITSLQAIDPIFADFSVPDIYVNQIKIGNVVVVTSRAIGATYQGKVFAINSRVNSDTRTLDVRSAIPNPAHALVPGTYVQVTVYFGQPAMFIILSQDAIAYDLSGPYVYKVVNNRAVKAPVKLGDKLDNNEVIVLQGLKEGDVIVTAGQLKLSDGAPVVVQPMTPAATPTVNSGVAQNNK